MKRDRFSCIAFSANIYNNVSHSADRIISFSMVRTQSMKNETRSIDGTSTHYAHRSEWNEKQQHQKKKRFDITSINLLVCCLLSHWIISFSWCDWAEKNECSSLQLQYSQFVYSLSLFSRILVFFFVRFEPIYSLLASLYHHCFF